MVSWSNSIHSGCLKMGHDPTNIAKKMGNDDSFDGILGYHIFKNTKIWYIMIYLLSVRPSHIFKIYVAKTMAMYRNPWDPMTPSKVIPGLVNCHRTMERSIIFNGKTHYKWSIFNSYVSHYQRVRATQRTLNKPWLVFSSHHCTTFHSPPISTD